MIEQQLLTILAENGAGIVGMFFIYQIALQQGHQLTDAIEENTKATNKLFTIIQAKI